MDIEEVAKKDPNAIVVHPINFTTGLTTEAAGKIADSLSLKPHLRS
jgi:succinyl-CoA synthetase beta subunit